MDMWVLAARVPPLTGSPGYVGPGGLSTTPLQGLLELHQPLQGCLWKFAFLLACTGTCAQKQLQEQTLVRKAHTEVD